MDLSDTVSGLLTNLGAFTPVAGIGWWIVKTQRADLTKERDDARQDLKDAIARNNALADTVIALAGSVEKTMAELVILIRNGRPPTP